jgi:copper chaperone
MILLKIEGMTCGHCVASVKTALSAVTGAEAVEVDLKAGTAKVGGTPEPSALLEAVEEEGFTAVLAQ